MPSEGRFEAGVVKNLYVDVLHTIRCNESHPPTRTQLHSHLHNPIKGRQVRVTCMSLLRRMPYRLERTIPAELFPCTAQNVRVI